MYFMIKYQIDNGSRVDDHECIIVASSTETAMKVFYEEIEGNLKSSDEYIPYVNITKLSNTERVIYNK